MEDIEEDMLVAKRRLAMADRELKEMLNLNKVYSSSRMRLFDANLWHFLIANQEVSLDAS